MITRRIDPKTTIDYGNRHGMWGHPDYDEVRFDARRGKEAIRCRVAFKFLENRFGLGRHVHLARQHFDQITDEIGRLIAAGTFEPDGSVLLKG